MHPMTVALAVHSVVAVILVGGLYFAALILRPSGPTDEPSLTLWREALARFLPRIWVFLLVLIGSGAVMVHLTYGRVAGTPPFVRLMAALAVALTAAFAYLHLISWRRLNRTVATSGWPAAQPSVQSIRRLLVILLLLGAVIVLIASGGRYFS